MWLKWLPWRLIIRHVARGHGFLDPILLFSNIRKFAQPSEVTVPIETLRAGVLLQARGLINTQAIQHNLDWIWPFWVEQQFNPLNVSFIPRAFSLTHINLTNRNWTAIGLPDYEQIPIVDPRGLLTPFFDGWSLDGWIIAEEGRNLLPSRLPSICQRLLLDGYPVVHTRAQNKHNSLDLEASVIKEKDRLLCRLCLNGNSDVAGWLVVALRPYNPEGISFVHQINLLSEGQGWKVNDNQEILFNTLPDRVGFSHYREGDVYRHIPCPDNGLGVKCDVGMATAAALYRIAPGAPRKILTDVLMEKPKKGHPIFKTSSASSLWKENLQGSCTLCVPDSRFRFLFDAALKTTLLHTPGDVYPGPYTYKRFWFRDAVFILHAILCSGLFHRAERILNRFPSRQTSRGHFLSQEGEWDSNGQVLWILKRFFEMSGRRPPPAWKNYAYRAAHWILKKRLSEKSNVPHAGLLPSGFSAEHLGPNDYYYWDNFWSVAGLKAAAWLARSWGDFKMEEEFLNQAGSLLKAIERSLRLASHRLKRLAMPASPYRRLDSGSIGSLAAGYPLQIWPPDDERLKDTRTFLIENYLLEGGFFHEIAHSGINPYLTLHLAQILLREGDERYWKLMQSLAALASPTGQWPEAIHPRTKGGCMGDGQHVWAAAEWILMIRNCFVREESIDGRLILCSGIPEEWCRKGDILYFGPAPTSFGAISLTVTTKNDFIQADWDWISYFGTPRIEVRFPGVQPVRVPDGKTSAIITRD